MSDTWDCRVCDRTLYTKQEREEHERVAHSIGQQSLGGVVVIALLDTLRERLEPNCDVLGCDDDPEPMLVEHGLVLLCFDHSIEYLREVEGVGGSA